MTMTENVKLINEVLGRDDLTEADVTCLADDWRAFCNNPMKYADTVVPLLVNQYLDEDA